MNDSKPKANNRDEVCMDGHTAIKMPCGTGLAFLHNTPLYVKHFRPRNATLAYSV